MEEKEKEEIAPEMPRRLPKLSSSSLLFPLAISGSRAGVSKKKKKRKKRKKEGRGGEKGKGKE